MYFSINYLEYRTLAVFSSNNNIIGTEVSLYDRDLRKFMTGVGQSFNEVAYPPIIGPNDVVAGYRLRAKKVIVSIDTSSTSSLWLF